MPLRPQTQGQSRPRRTACNPATNPLSTSSSVSLEQSTRGNNPHRGVNDNVQSYQGRSICPGNNNLAYHERGAHLCTNYRAVSNFVELTSGGAVSLTGNSGGS